MKIPITFSLSGYNARDGNGDIPKLNSWIEEADNKVVGHIKYALTVQKCTRILTLSNDTDTFIVLLSYMFDFISLGLKELWIQYGTGDHRRMTPVHEAYSVSGPVLSKIIMKSYVITGNDYLSKIGTKHAALSCNPELFLLNLGDTEMLTEQDIFSC